MKVRFGYTIGPEVSAEHYGSLIGDLERLGFDSVWVPESLQQGTLDPIVALTWAAARTSRLKLGSHVVLPGRQPVHLARQLAQLDRLSGGRLLLLGVLGVNEEADSGAQGIARADRSAAVEEMVPLLRRLWRGEVVDHDGPRYPLRGVSIGPTPMQEPLELWLAGQAPGALARCGRLGDGWMPGLVLPEEAGALRVQVEAAAADAGRVMDPEHFGANLFYALDDLPAAVVDRLSARRTDGDARGLVPVGAAALRRRVQEWLDVGFSKFLLRPVSPTAGSPADATAELERLAAGVLPLTT